MLVLTQADWSGTMSGGVCRGPHAATGHHDPALATFEVELERAEAHCPGTALCWRPVLDVLEAEV
jgi:hypothetical protein